MGQAEVHCDSHRGRGTKVEDEFRLSGGVSAGVGMSWMEAVPAGATAGVVS